MAEEIVQKLGFDAAAALTTLANLEKSIAALNATIGASPELFSAFNAKAGKTVAALKHLSTNSKTAATDLQKVINLQGKISTPQQGSAPGAAGGATPKPPKTPDLSPYLAQLQEMFKISGAASKEQKRAFQSAITSAAEFANKHKKTAGDIANTNANMSQNMTGTANKLANALANISRKSKIAPPDTTDYVKKVQSLIPLTANATAAQKRSWQSLSAKIAETAVKSGISINQMASIHGKLGQSLKGSANKIANDMQRMEGSTKELKKTWTVSWETMARVVATQAIVRALSAIRTALKASIGDAVKFQRAIAEIGTIGRKLGGLDAIGDMVQRVSDQFNVGLADTAEAAYQTVSNQIADTEAAVESFLGSAAKFSKITKTDMATSVNLLSGTLNAFGKQVTDTEEVAAKFFATIELGRTRAEELALGYGTVAPIADKLGISMEELNASVATLTINGIQTDKAFTQIRGTMQGFLKPTTEMKKAMTELGFATGEQILQAYNLQDAVIAVTETTGMNAAAIAKLFPRIRGLTGVLTLVNDEAGHFTDTLEAQRTALEKTYGEAYQIVIETPAEKITKDLNKLKNFFTVEFGQSVLEAGVKFSEAFGGVDTILTGFEAIIPVLPQVATGLGIVAGALFLVATNAALAKANMGLLGKASLAFVGVYASISLGKEIARQIVDGWTEGLRETKKGIAKDLEARQTAIKAHISLEKTKIDEIVSLIARGLAKQRKLYFQQVDAAKEANAEQIKDVKSLTDKMIADRQRLVSKLQSQVSSMGKNILASEDRAGSLRDQLDDQLFQRKIGRESEHQQRIKLTQKSAELASDAVRKIAAASTEDERASADEEFQRAKAFAEQALAIADGTGNRRLAEQAMRHLASITEDVIDAEGRYQQNVARSAQAVVKRTRIEERRVEKLKEKQKELLEAFSLTDKDTGELLPQAERQEQIAKAQKTLREFVDLSGDPLDVATMLNYAGVSAQLAQELHTGRIQELVISTGALKSISDQVSRALNSSRIDDPSRVSAENLTGIEITGPVSEAKALEELQEKYDAVFAKKEEYLSQGNLLISSQKELTESLKATQVAAKDISAFTVLVDAAKKLASVPLTLENIGKAPQEIIDAAPETALDRYRSVLEEMQTLAEKAAKGISIDPEAVIRLGDALHTASKEVGALGIFDGGLGKISLTAIETVISLKKVADAQQALKKSTGDSTIGEINKELGQLDTSLEALKASAKAAEEMSNSVSSVAPAIGSAVEPSAAIASSWSSIRANADRVVAAASQLQQVGVVSGGDQVASLDRAKASADQLQTAIGGVKMHTDGTKMAQDGHTSAVASTQFAVQSLTGSYTQLLGVIRAASSAQASLQSRPAVTAAKGGRMSYFAAGGRGTDVIPAMLTQGEFVTNAKSSQRFFSQLQAMNAGQTPVFKSEGGDTYNTNVGDINVSGTGSPQVVARDVMRAIRREERRGSGR